MNTGSDQNDFLAWMGFKRKPDFRKSSPLGAFVGVVLVLLGATVAVGGLATLIQFISVALQFEADDEAIRNIGLIVVAVFGAPFVVWRAAVAQKQANTAEQNHITDQINKAVSGLGAVKVMSKIGRPVKIYMGKSSEVVHLVERPSEFELKPRSVETERYYDTSLSGEHGEDVFEGTHVRVRSWEQERTEIEWQGSPLTVGGDEAIGTVGDWEVFAESVPNIEVRVGAIYALERISQDSARDHIQIMEILTAYIRENAPVGDLEPSDEPIVPARPRTDIQAALDVIGRRSQDRIELEHSRKYRLDLREVNLAGANFSRGNYEGAYLFGSRLEAANFRSTNLKATRLNSCLLNFAEFFQANLLGAVLDNAKIDSTGTWQGSIILAETMRGVSLANADISALQHLPNTDTHSPTFGTKDTTLHHWIEAKRDERKKDIEQFMYLANGNEIEDPVGVNTRLKEDGFRYWSPFDSTDGATNSLRAKLWDDIGLVGFPFREN